MTNIDRIAAVMLMLCASTAANAEFGRMFFTPAQRATLDDARKKNRQIEIGSDSAPVVAPAPRNISVNGIVRSSDGKSTVWLNNRAVTGQHADGLNVSTNRNDGRVKLSVPGSGRSVDLKVGQTVEIVSGTIADSYSRRVSPKPEETRLPGTANSATTGDKGAASQAVPPPIPAAAAQKKETPDKDLRSQPVVQHNSNAQSK